MFHHLPAEKDYILEEKGEIEFRGKASTLRLYGVKPSPAEGIAYKAK